LRREAEVVKTPPEANEKTAGRGSFRRHLQGYELGLVTVGMVLTCALLALPRASVPQTLPLPRIDRAEVRRSAATELQLSALAEAQELPFEIRALGEAIRHFGRSVSRGIDTEHDRDDIRERLQAVQAKDQGPLLLRLRAVQTQFFLEALADFERDGKPNTDLDELGADFVPHAKRNGWLTPDGRCMADEATRRVLFRMHWADLLEKRSAFPFAPTLNEWRTYYRFLLLHPEPEPGAMTDSSDDNARLRIVDALSRKDPEYPASFAKGYLLANLGEPEAAATAFRAELGLHESGPYALLARNYLIHSLQDVSPE